MADEEIHECFIVGVIGKEGSEQRIHADWFIDGIVTPVFAEHFPNFVVRRADRMNTPGMITSQIIDKLLTAKLVIADMTFLNANAFYEIGIRHMTGLPIIHAHRDGDSIPFDVSTFLSLPFSLVQHQHMLAARAGLKSMMDNVLADGFQMENPVTQARGRAKFDETASSNDQVLQAQIDQLMERMAWVELQPGTGTKSQAIARALMAPATPWRDALQPGTRYEQISILTTRQSSYPSIERFVEEVMKPNEMLGYSIHERPTKDGITVLLSREFPRELLAVWQKRALDMGLDFLTV